MEISELITIMREDFLSDTFEGWEDATEDEKNDQFIWTDSFLLRALTEAQRQACNRTDFLYDDSTATLSQITMIEGQSTYSINKAITFIEYASFDGSQITHYSKDEFSTSNPDWRTDTGMTGKVVSFLMRGHKLTVHPTPDIDDVGKIINLEIYHLPLDSLSSTSDDLVIPDEYHRDLIWWVLSEAFKKRDAEGYDPGKASEYGTEFTNVFGEYVPSEVRLNQLNENKVLTARSIAYTTDLTTSSSDYDEDW